VKAQTERNILAKCKIPFQKKGVIMYFQVNRTWFFLDREKQHLLSNTGELFWTNYHYRIFPWGKNI